MTTRHASREVRIFALYNNSVEGQHFGVVCGGTWAQCLRHIAFNAPYAGSRTLFVEGTDGKLRPLLG